WSLSGVAMVEDKNNLSAKATDAAGNTGTSANFAAPTLVSVGPAQITVLTPTAQGFVVLGNGSLDVGSGRHGSREITIGNGGVVNVLAGGTTQHTDILNGGTQYDYGTALDTNVESGGVQHVYFGGSATGTTVADGAYQDVYHGSVTDTSLSGDQQVL